MAMRKVIVGLLPLVLLAGSFQAWAQATTGSISGRVADPQGSVVQGAHISIQDVDTGVITTAVTNQSGEFIVTALPPDHYTIIVESAGFDTANVPAFALDIDQKARFNIPMKVGAVSTNVVVNDSAPVLQLQGAETGQVIGTREIEDLPLDGRNFTSLMLLVPGVGSGGGGNNLNLSVNGQREFSNSVQINGTEVTGNRNNDTNMVPSPDALQEFKMVTSSYAPEIGRASGGSVLIQTKSGSNANHGSAYFFYRPTATAANPAVSPSGTVPALQQKIYGATFGGPIKKDKAFFFLAFEGNRLQNNFSYFDNTPTVNQVKFDSAGDADLSGLTDPESGNQIPIFNPFFFENNYYSEQFPNNLIPANMVSPGGKQILLNLFPQPLNTSPGVTAFYENFPVSQAYTDNNNVANLRMDYTLSPKDRIYLTYDAEQGDTSTADPYAGHIPVKNGGSGDSGDLTSFENNVIALKSDHVFSANLLNEAGVSYFLSTVSQNSPLAGSMLANTWNIQNVVIPGFPSTNNLPQVQFGTGPTAGGSTYKPLTFRDVNLSFVEALTWTRGRHNAKFGYEYRHLNSHPNFSLFPTPYWYFGGPGQALTSDPDYGFYDPNSLYYNGGSEIADLLLGVPEVAYQGLQLTNASTTANEHSFYLQDYWQVTPKVNITYGLRYEYQQPYVEANNSEANFDINTLVINLAGRGGNSRSLVNSNTKDFMPRVGLSYQLLPTWVLRAGFGIFYSPENDAREDILTKNYPFFTQQAFYNSDYYIGYILDSGSPRSTSITIPSGASSIDLTKVAGGNSQTVYSEPTDFPTASSRNYNLTVEKQLGRATSAEIGYVGANTRNLSYSVGNYNVNNHLSSAIGNVQALMPSGFSNYDSLQAKINRSFQNGYSILGSYTYAHGRDNGPAPFDLGKGGNYPQSPFNLVAEYANSDTDLRHHFSASQIIELPFGHGKHWLSNATGATQSILGGWQLNSITTLQTGKPFNVISNGENKYYPGLRPNLTGSAKQGHPTTSEWFNTKAFSIPSGQAASTNPGKTLITGDSPRNPLYGPGYTNEDLSLFKVLTLPKEMKFQIRIESFNLLNTGHYDNPVGDMNAGAKFGTIQGGYYPRVMQFAGRLTF